MIKQKPKFILSKSKVFENVDVLKQIVDEVSYSWKTNPDVGKILDEKEYCYQSVHSFNELKQVKNKNKVWYFGFALNEMDLEELTKKEKINNFVIDNLEDLQVLLDFIGKFALKVNILLRMKLRENTLQTGKHFVFGLNSEIVKEQLLILRQNENVSKIGIHVHRKTQNVAEWNLIEEIAEVLGEKVLEKIDLINIGGGLPGNYKNINNKLQKNILKKIKDFTKYVHQFNIKTIIEPGRFIASSAVKLETQIIAIQDNTLFLNCSIFNGALDTVIANIKLLVEGELEKENKEGKRYVLKGSTPDSTDILRYSVYLEDPKIGSNLTFLNCGAYNHFTDFCSLEKIEYEFVD